MKPEDPKKVVNGVESGEDNPNEMSAPEGMDALEEADDATEALEQTASGVGVFFLALVISVALLLGAGWLLGRTSAENERKTLAAERDATITEQSATIAVLNDVITQKEAEIEASAKEIKRLERRLTPVTEDGVIAARMFEFYGYSSYDRSPAFETDAEFKEWCQGNYPEAVFPSNEWTAEEVIASWTEKPEIWGCWSDNDYYYRATYFCWTPDWEHCFMFDAEGAMVDYDTSEHQGLTSGWLVVDGIRVAMLDKETYDISDPYELIRQYQSGEWDGCLRRSPDGSTTVEVETYGDGPLSYRYQAWFYDESFDPEGMAYRCLWKTLDLRLYGDLPVGYEMGGDAVLDRGRNSTRYMDQTGVKIFQKGEALYEWNFADFGFDCAPRRDKTVLFAAFENPTEKYAQDVLYLYDGRDRLIALREDGSAEVILSQMVYKDARNGEFWGFQDGELTYWRLYERFANELPTVVAENVLEVDFSGASLFMKADGCYVAARDYDGDAPYKAVYLGPESPEYYMQIVETVYDGEHFWVYK